MNSDHFPMFVELSYEPDQKSQQPEVKPEKDTEKDANKILRKGDWILRSENLP